MANFSSNPKAAENREGSAIPYPPRPAIPLTPLERLAKRDVSPQPKGRLGTETGHVGLDPSVEWIPETTSWRSLPPPTPPLARGQRVIRENTALAIFASCAVHITWLGPCNSALGGVARDRLGGRCDEALLKVDPKELATLPKSRPKGTGRLDLGLILRGLEGYVAWWWWGVGGWKSLWLLEKRGPWVGMMFWLAWGRWSFGRRLLMNKREGNEMRKPFLYLAWQLIIRVWVEILKEGICQFIAVSSLLKSLHRRLIGSASLIKSSSQLITI